MPEPDDGPFILRVNWTLWTLSTLCIVLRIVARKFFLEGRLGWDDWTILGVWCLATPSNAIITVLVDNGLGKNIWMNGFDNITNVLFYFFIEEYLYLGSVMLTKISIVLLYMRVIPVTVSVRFRYICLTLIGLMTANTIAMLFGLSFQASPISYSWTLWSGETQGTTLDLKAQQWSFSILNLCWDLIVFALPIPRLMSLQVPDWRKKAMVILTFLLGLFGTVCTCIRFKYLSEWGQIANVTYHYGNIAIWSEIEGHVGTSPP